MGKDGLKAIPRPASLVAAEQEQKWRVLTKLNIFISRKRNWRSAPGWEAAVCPLPWAP